MHAPAVGVFLPTLTERGEPVADVVAAARHAPPRASALGRGGVADRPAAAPGAPLPASPTVRAAAAGATRRVRLGFGVMILPLRPVAWAAKQVASLQHVSGDRLVLGVGV